MRCIVRSSFTYRGVSYRPGQPVDLTEHEADRMIAGNIVTADASQKDATPEKPKAKETAETSDAKPTRKPAAKRKRKPTKEAE